MGKRYSVEVNDFHDHQDEPPWRSYDLTAEGNTLDELIEDACVFECDQDGGELGNYPLRDMGGKFFDDAVKGIGAEMEREDCREPVSETDRLAAQFKRLYPNGDFYQQENSVSREMAEEERTKREDTESCAFIREVKEEVT